MIVPLFESILNSLLILFYKEKIELQEVFENEKTYFLQYVGEKYVFLHIYRQIKNNKKSMKILLTYLNFFCIITNALWNYLKK